MATKRLPAKAVSPELRPYLTGDKILADLDAKSRRRIARDLASIAANGSPQDVSLAEQALTHALTGKVKDARSLGATIVRSKRRDLLIRAWRDLLQRLARTNPPPEEVRPRVEWIVATIPKFRGLSETDARDLLTAAVLLAASADRAWLRSRSAILALSSLLRPMVPDSVDTIVRGILGGRAAFDHRATVAREISQRDATADGQLRRRLIEQAIYSEPDFGVFLLSDASSDRIDTLTSIMTRAASRTDEELSHATQVLESLCEDNPRSLAAYVPALLLLAVAFKRLPIRAVDLLAQALYQNHPDSQSGEPLLRVLDDVMAKREEVLRHVIGTRERELEAAVSSLEVQRNELSASLEASVKLIESLKTSEQRARILPEHTGRLAVLGPLCSIHQEMLLVLRESPDQRLLGFTRVIQSLLVRQGVRLQGSEGQIIRYDPNLHEPIEGAKVEPGAHVEVLAPGYQIDIEAIGLKESLARAAVRRVQERD